MKKFVLFLAAFFSLGMAFVSCSDDDDEVSNPSEPVSTDFAPESLVGKVIRWDEYLVSGGSSGYDSRIEFYTETDMRSNFSSESSSYTYVKTSSNTAKLNFICSQRINYVTRVFRYYVTLKFFGL